MTPEQITPLLQEIFGRDALLQTENNSWQVDTPELRFLILLSENRDWLRILVPITSAAEANPFLEELMEANFDETQQVRYALHQEVLWGVFQHNFKTLEIEDCRSAIAILIKFKERGVSEIFNQLVEKRIRQIVYASKLQGQTLEATIQTLERFYQEGMLGSLKQDPQEREEFLNAWRYQLKRLWSEVEP